MGRCVNGMTISSWPVWDLVLMYNQCDETNDNLLLTKTDIQSFYKEIYIGIISHSKT